MIVMMFFGRIALTGLRKLRNFHILRFIFLKNVIAEVKRDIVEIKSLFDSSTLESKQGSDE